MRPQHRHSQGGGRGCGTKIELSGIQGADGFSLKNKAESFPLQPGHPETLAVPLFHSLELCSLCRGSRGETACPLLAAGSTRVVYLALLF